jgi:serine/threonine protein kinase
LLGDGIQFDTQRYKQINTDFEVLGLLGKGAFGKVYLVRRLLTNDMYAMKVIKIYEGLDSKKIENIANENDIFRKISGEYLVKAAFSFSEGGLHMLFLEYMEGGDFSHLLSDEVYLDQDTAKFYLAEIVLAIEHLHKLNIIHRDLKPQNLVLSSNGHLKLTDFGLSKEGVTTKVERTRSPIF